jgi:RHS repeat-associated protein
MSTAAPGTTPPAPHCEPRPPRIARARNWISTAVIAILVAAAALSYGLPDLGKSRPAGSSRAVASSKLVVSNHRLGNPVATRSTGAPVRPAPSSLVIPVGSVPPASAEVLGLRTRTSRTYLVNGEHEAVLYSGSVNYQDSTGTWQSIDDSLTPTSVPGYAWQNKANRYTLLLPSTLSVGPILFQSPTGTIGLRLSGAGGTATISGASATYANALSGVSVTLSAENDAVKEALMLSGPQSARSLVYSLTLSAGLRASATAGGGIGITDSSGKLQFSFDRPTIVDASGAEAPVSAAALNLGTSQAGATVTLALDSAWLGSSLRQWPVTVDPSISYTANQDCEIENGAGVNTNYCGSGSKLMAGFDQPNAKIHRSVLLFNVQNAIPAGAQVKHASLNLYLDSATTTSYANIDAYQLTQPWTNAVTWNKYDGSNAWTTAGGTFVATALGAKKPTTAGWYAWGNSATSLLAQSWLNGTVANDGLLLHAATESNNELYTFDSTRQTNSPQLEVFYVNALGERSSYGSESHQLTDRSQLSVNVANGNLATTSGDLQIKGTGLDLSVQRIYNSLGDCCGAFGTWLMGGGMDEHLTVIDQHINLQGPGGWDLTFYSNGSGGYAPPPGADSSLVANLDGTYTLTQNATAEQLHFNSAGVLTSDVDRNGDTIVYTTTGGNLSSITDTQGRQVTFSYSSPVAANLVSKVTDSTGRNWQYLYTSANGFAELTQYTDPAGRMTTYAYDSSGRINRITDPLTNQTTFAYDSQSRVASMTYVTNTVNGTGPTTTYGYHSNAAGSCAAAPSGDTLAGYTIATDANSHATTYCYDLEGLVLQVIAPSNSTSNSYTSDQHVAVSADGFSQPTTNIYNSSNDLTKSTAPALGSGQVAPSFSGTYNTPTTVTGYQYLPSSVTDPQGHCSAILYDTAGRVIDSYGGQTTPCDGHTGGTHVSHRYQGDPGTSCGGKVGELCSVTNGLGGTTSYGYDSNGNGISVTSPSPLGASTIVPDALSRVSSVTDGKGQTTSYLYDNLDRVTQTLFSGATLCTPASGNCITYSYDVDGNRTTMVDQSGTTTYYYDALNRMTTKSLPDTTSLCAGSSPAGITYSYDGVGTMIAYCDSSGTTTYGYDPSNRLTSMSEPGGNCGSTPSLCTTFAYNSDDNRTIVTFPGGATQTTAYDNDQNVTSVVGKSSTGATLSSFAYTYVSGANDTPLVQTAAENDAVASSTYTYSYDAFNRLAGGSVTSGIGTSVGYTYDANGNMLTRTAGSATTTYAYNGADQLCWAYAGSSSNTCPTTPTGATTYNFDADGNATSSSAGASFSYNGKNQSTSITYGGTTLSSIAYADTGQQERISAGSTSFDNVQGDVGISTTAGASTYYLRDDQGTVLGERVGSAHYYLLTDRLGSVVAVISGDGQTVSDRYGYDAYGVTTYKTGSVANPFGYAGGFTDPTGLIKFGDRFYDAATARWTQVDPAASGVSSPYAYADGNPANETDPSGAFGICCVHYDVRSQYLGWPFYRWGLWHHWYAEMSQGVTELILWAGATVTGAIGGALGAALGSGLGLGGSIAGAVAGAVIGAVGIWFYLWWVSRGGADGVWLNATWDTLYGRLVPWTLRTWLDTGWPGW